MNNSQDRSPRTQNRRKQTYLPTSQKYFEVNSNCKTDLRFSAAVSMLPLFETQPGTSDECCFKRMMTIPWEKNDSLLDWRNSSGRYKTPMADVALTSQVPPKMASIISVPKITLVDINLIIGDKFEKMPKTLENLSKELSQLKGSMRTTAGLTFYL